MTMGNKLLKGIAIGAMVGAIISLLDRETRKKSFGELRDMSKTAYEIVKDPEQVMLGVRENVDKMSNQLKSFSNDFSYLSKKINKDSYISSITTDIKNDEIDIGKNNG